MKTQYIHVRASADTKEKLQELANAEGITPSAWMTRQISIEYTKLLRVTILKVQSDE